MAKKKRSPLHDHPRSHFADGGLVSDSEDTGTAKARSEAVDDERIRKKLKDHSKYWSSEYKAKHPKPDFSDKNRFDDDKIEISPLVKVYKKGGLVKGPGGPKDDKVKAMLSNGEFVVKASAVKKVGDGSTDKGADRLKRLDRSVLHDHSRS